MQEKLIVTFTDQERDPFDRRVNEISAIDGIIEVETWNALNGTIILVIDKNLVAPIMNSVRLLPYVASVQRDGVTHLDKIIYEPINVAASQQTQLDTGLLKYIAYHKDGERKTVTPPWAGPEFDYAVPVNLNRRGAGIYVCVMDSGIEPTNSEFTGRTIIELPRRGLNSIGFHGTACAQYIGGNTFGLASDCVFIDANCFGNSGSTSNSNIVASMGDLADYVETNLTNGEIVVANMSFSGTTAGTYDGPLRELMNLGVFCFASSGNNASDNIGIYPSSLLKWGAVGATDYYLNRARFSNWGENVILHGLGRLLPFKGTLEDASNDGVITFISGTSFSCPYVVGCFVTWIADKKAPSSLEGVELLQKQFIRTQCRKNYVTDRLNRLNTDEAVFAFADNSDFNSSIIIDGQGLETILCYKDPANGIGVKQTEIALTYGGEMTDYIITNNPTTFGGDFSTVAGHFPDTYAGHCIRFPVGQGTRIMLPENENELWISFYLRSGDPSNNFGYIPAFHFSSDNFRFPAIGIYVRGNSIAWFRQTDGNSNNSNNWALANTNALPANTLSRMDIFIRFEEPGQPLHSTVQFYINGVLSYELDAAPRYDVDMGAGYDRAFYLGNPGASVPAFDDFFSISNVRVSTTDTRGKDFASYFLNAVGTYNEFDLDGFDALTDTTDTKLARTQVAGQRLSGTLDFASITDPSVITEVKLITPFLVDSEFADPNAIGHFIRVGTTDYDAALFSPDTTRDILLTSFSNNPDTNAAWNLAEIENMQFGLRSGNV